MGIFNIKNTKVFKNISSKKVFIFLFAFMLIFPMIISIFYLDWEYLKISSFEDLVSVGYKKRVASYLNQNIPFYDKLLFFRPNINFLTKQSSSDDVYFLKDVGFIKFTNSLELAKEETFLNYIYMFSKAKKGPVYYLVTPSKFQIYGGNLSGFTDSKLYRKGSWFNIDKFKSSNANYKDDFEQIFRLDENILFNKSLRENVFYRTSDRLNSGGMYLLYSSNMNMLGQESYSLSDFYILHAVDDYYGELYNKNLKMNVSADTVDVFIFGGKDFKLNVKEVHADGSISTRNTIFDNAAIYDFDKTNILFGKPAPIKVVETNLYDKEDILIFADESINSMMQFLSLHYKKLTVVDLREIFEISNLKFFVDDIKLKKYDKVLFMYDVKNISNISQFKNLIYFIPPKKAFVND